jgi:hypothetical protein
MMLQEPSQQSADDIKNFFKKPQYVAIKSQTSSNIKN